MQFQGFKPEAMQRIAGTLGYNGDMSKFDGYLEANPEAKQKMDMYSQQAVNMMNGGVATKNFYRGGPATRSGLNSRGFDRNQAMNRMKDANRRSNEQTFFPTSCPSPDTLIDLLDGNKKQAGKLQVGDMLRTQHEDTLEWGDYPVSHVSIVPNSERLKLVFNDSEIICSLSHKFYVDGKGWTTAEDIELNDTVSDKELVSKETSNVGDVVRITVEDAHTYVAAGLISHNKSPPPAYPVYPDTEQIVLDTPTVTTTPTPTKTGQSITDITANRIEEPTLPDGTKVNPIGTNVLDSQLVDTTAGNVSGTISASTSTADTNTATAADATDTNTVTTTGTKADVDKSLTKLEAAEGTVDPNAKVIAQEKSTTSVSNLEGAEGTSVDVEAIAKRKMEVGERVDPVADAASAAKFTEEIEAVTATPTEKATVKGQLGELMEDFEGGKTPPWAAGAMRAATAAMAARGLGSSSMAGQALIQAAMESALPIASADAGTFAKFESQNLSNRQQRAMLAAEQRATFMGQEFDQKFQARVANASKVSDIANMNFTAEQQVALENSRAANTMELANLSNDQAVVMAEAAALSSLDLASLNNRQQAEVINSQNLMQMDMANLSNTQQTNIFKAQQRVQSLFSDKAAENAANQFNASSENQTDQFFANLKTQTSQFNTSQKNAQEQFNAGEENTQERFTKEMMNQREQFNANNKVAIDQSNAVWRREVATANTAAINRSNEVNASALLDMSNTAYNNTWQYYADTMENAYTATNNERDRMTKLAVAKLEVDSSFDIAKWQADATSSAAVGSAIVKIATTDFNGSTILEKAWKAIF